MSKVLLREYYALCEGGVCQDLLTEDDKRYIANGGMMLSGKLQEADVQNGNGRVYPHKVMMREVNNYQKLVKEQRALGELDHPDWFMVGKQKCYGESQGARHSFWENLAFSGRIWCQAWHLIQRNGIRDRR